VSVYVPGNCHGDGACQRLQAGNGIPRKMGSTKMGKPMDRGERGETTNHSDFGFRRSRPLQMSLSAKRNSWAAISSVSLPSVFHDDCTSHRNIFDLCLLWMPPTLWHESLTMQADLASPTLAPSLHMPSGLMTGQISR
jgi:hypothetical protein